MPATTPFLGDFPSEQSSPSLPFNKNLSDVESKNRVNLFYLKDQLVKDWSFENN